MNYNEKELGIDYFKDYVSARWAAVNAGLGQYGRNNFIYTEEFGSWVRIETWTVDVELVYGEEKVEEKICPPNCNLCIKACPTKALSGEFSMDRGKCITQLNAVASEIPAEGFREDMGCWLYGCEVCQNVCPKNRDKWTGEEDFPGLDQIAEYNTLDKLYEITDQKFRDLIQPHFWYYNKNQLCLWKCHVLRAMLNSGEAKYQKYFKKALDDCNDKVRDFAGWVCKKIGI